MARNPVTFSNGTLVQKAQVEIDGNIYEVEPAQYDGTTPLSASNLNLLQTRLYDYIDEQSEKILLTGSIDMIDGNGSKSINYPTGLNRNNCFVLSVMLQKASEQDNPYSYGIQPDLGGYSMGAIYKAIAFRENDILFRIKNYTTAGDGTFNYKILLIKIN